MNEYEFYVLKYGNKIIQNYSLSILISIIINEKLHLLNGIFKLFRYNIELNEIENLTESIFTYTECINQLNGQLNKINNNIENNLQKIIECENEIEKYKKLNVDLEYTKSTIKSILGY